jgi:hypothetical protein
MTSLPNTKRIERVPCKHHQQGKCTRGKSCPFAHIDKREEARNSAMAVMLRLVFEKQEASLFGDGGRHLNLNGMKKIPDLEKVSTSVDFDSMAFCDALVSVIRTHALDVQYLNLDGNEIRSLFHFLKCLERADLHNGIRGISARDNNVTTYEFIKQLKEFSNLSEIQLAGNPIAEKADYRATIRKGLPTLEGLDGEGVNRPPLNLPWPQPTEQNDTTIAMLQRLEEHLYRNLEAGGTIDALSSVYGDDAMYSMTCGEEASVKAPTLGSEVNRRNVIIRDFVAMRMAQTDRDNNAKTARSIKTARGRTDVCSALRATMYPRTMHCMHVLSPDSHVTTVADGLRREVHLFVFHGTVSWKHKEQPDDAPVVTRNFDRSLTVCTNADGTFFILNDCVALRPHDGAPVWYAQTDRRKAQLATKYDVDPSVMRTVVDMSSTDIDVDKAAKELQGLGAEHFAACFAIAGGNEAHAVLVARLANRTLAPPDVAYGALASCGFDLEAAASALASNPA